MTTSTGIELATSKAGTVAPYRNDIDGLRAVAILLVVVYHVWIGRVSGGVDAFLMISAFFLTGSFVRRLEAGSPLEILGQLSKTFKRLLPPAAVVLVATLVAGYFILSENRLIELFQHIWASLFYSENWRLAYESIDYYADKSQASPVQHFWSLSVQGQVFLLWPLLFLLIRAIAKRFHTNIRTTSFVVLAAVFTISFIYSVITTHARQEFAYFDTGARIWEFALGGLLAVSLPWVNLPGLLRAALGWIGMLALLSCGLLIDVEGGFPGYLALWPTLSVAAIILAGTGQKESGVVTRALSWKPLVKLGHDAYGLYLVHWPILIFVLVLKRGEPLSFRDGLMILVASMVLARLITWLVDDRIRYASWANKNRVRGLFVIATSVLIVAAPTGYLHWTTKQAILSEQESIRQLEATNPGTTHPGAAVLQGNSQGEPTTSAPPTPLSGTLDAEWGGLPESCADMFPVPFGEQSAGCNILDNENPNLTVVVIGDSHAQQWLEPIESISGEKGWRVFSFVKGGCSLSGASSEEYEAIGREPTCVPWMDAILPQILEIQPDVVLTIGTRTASADQTNPARDGEREIVPFGLGRAVDQLSEAGIPTVLIRDNPRFNFNAYECGNLVNQGQALGEQFGATADCGVSIDRLLAEKNPALDLVGPGVATVDMTDFICATDHCPAIIGNVFVYLDDNHLTSTYAKTMTPMLEPRLVGAIDQATSWE